MQCVVGRKRKKALASRRWLGHDARHGRTKKVGWGAPTLERMDKLQEGERREGRRKLEGDAKAARIDDDGGGAQWSVPFEGECDGASLQPGVGANGPRLAVTWPGYMIVGAVPTQDQVPPDRVVRVGRWIHSSDAAMSLEIHSISF